MAIHLSTLPNELLGLIAEHLEDDAAALKALALASSHLQKVAEAVLYRRLFFRTGTQCTRLLHSLKTRPERATSVDFLDIRCKHSQDTEEEPTSRTRFYMEANNARPQGVGHEHIPGRESDTAGLLYIPVVLNATKNLKSLIMESPVCNYGRWQEGGDWDELMRSLFAPLEASTWTSQELGINPPLQCLRQLTLHLNGFQNRYWTMHKAFASLFAQAVLEELTLSCVTFSDDSLVEVQDLPRTPMKRLTLVECNLTSRGFLHIMSRPRALEYLYLGENRDHQDQQRPRGEYNELCAKSPAKFLAALEQQQHSLSEFCYRAAGDDFDLVSSKIPNDSAGFSAFDKLTVVRLDAITKSFESLITAETTRPPHLETIHLDCFSFDLDEHVPEVNELPDIEPVGRPSGLLRCFCRKAAGIKTLRSVNIAMQVNLFAEQLDAKHKAFESVGEMFDLKKVTFKVFMIIQQKWGLIPPYLYGEPEPLRELVYDATDGIKWVHNGDDLHRGTWITHDGSDVLDQFDFDVFLAGDGNDDNDPFDFAGLAQAADNDTI